MITRDVRVGVQRITEHWIITHDGSRRSRITIDAMYSDWDMSFDEAVLRATNGEILTPDDWV